MIFSLVGMLILLLMTWTVLDVGKATRTKFEAQASADMAAYSQAAVKARSMNMLAYTNIAKRSVVGIHALYEGMFAAYDVWVIEVYWPQCGSGAPGAASCADVEKELAQWRAERSGDLVRFEKLKEDYYMQDLIALDNYQKYIRDLTPWWGWTEAVVRAQRNSATLATSFPPPTGGTVRKFIPDLADDILRAVGSSGDNQSGINRGEELPVDFHAVDEDADNYMRDEGLTGDDFKYELSTNATVHQQNSALGAALDINIAAGYEYATKGGGQMRSYEALGRIARPVVFLDSIDSNESWLRATSNIIFTFHDNKDLFGTYRDNYRIPKQEYKLTTFEADEKLFRPQGYWSMARSEISYVPHEDSKGNKVKDPDMWHARWTARMRPVSLPNEFFYGNYSMNGVYYDIIPHLSLSQQIGTRETQSTDKYFHEMVWMERATRGMGQSTIEGVSK